MKSDTIRLPKASLQARRDMPCKRLKWPQAEISACIAKGITTYSRLHGGYCGVGYAGHNMVISELTIHINSAWGKAL